ncbi:MAG: SPFH domain-containing protein [Candidatus Promineifilaceae bacterium]
MAPKSQAVAAGNQRVTTRLPSKRTLYLLFLLALLVAYWIFVWRMERIVLTPADIPLAVLQSLPAWLVNFGGVFLPRVLRHFIPIILGWFLAYDIAVNLVYHLYDLPDRAKARGFLRRLRDPRRAGGATIAVTPQDLDLLRLDSSRLRVGGPGRVSIPAGHAAVTELNGRFYRVVGSGSRALDRFEFIHSVYDLRPQDRTDPEVVLYSKEGLEFVTNVSVTFRIAAPDMAVSVEQPFPYDGQTLHNLAYSQINLPGNQVSNWEDAPLATVKGTLSSTVATFSLDELLQDDQTELGSHLTIRRNVEREARNKLREQGIDLIRVRIGGFRFPEDVTDLHIRFWQADWDNQARLMLAEGQAVALEEMETVRAEAELDLIKAIANGMQQARQQGYRGTINEVVALRFLEALEKMALESESEIDLPEKLLPQLQNLQSQLQLAAAADSPSINDHPASAAEGTDAT